MSIKVQCHNHVNPEQWDEQAATLGGGFHHCHAATIYRARALQAEPLFIRAVDDRGRCVGIAAGAVASSRIWPFSRYCRLASFEATPVAGGDAQLEIDLLKTVERYLRDLGVFRIGFSSYHSPNSNRLLPEGDYALTRRAEYSFDLTRSLDELFNAFHSTRRKEVRRAEKRGVIVQEVNMTEAMNMVRHFHNLSMERRGIPVSPPKDPVIAARHELLSSGRVHVLVSYWQGQPEGAMVLGLFNGQAYGLEGGSSDQGNRNFSMTHLTWTAVGLFKERGAVCLSLGGAKEDEEGLRKFKQEFGTIETSQPAGYKIISRFGGRLDALRACLRRKGGPHRAKGHVQSRRSSGPAGPGEVSCDSASRKVPEGE